MMDTMKIAPAALTDIDEIVALVNSAYRGDSSKKGWTTEADLLEGQRIDAASLQAIMQHPTHTILKCVNDENKIIGTVLLEQHEDYFYLGMLTVQPDLQTSGIGKQLMNAAETYAKANNVFTIKMTVISVRHELIAWYERRGYKNTGETKPFPTDIKFGIQKQALEFIVMEKHLP